MSRRQTRAAPTAPPTEHDRPSWTARLPMLVIPLLAAAAYSQGFRNSFVHWDDAYFIAENPALRDAAGLLRIWTPGSDPVRKFYPLTFTLHWLEYRLWGERPTGYFAVGLMLHALNALLVFRLARALGGGPLTAWTAGCLFAVHPMHVATVAWLASRKNVLATTFALLALLAHLHWRQAGRAGSYCAALACVIAALLSKTGMLTVPVAILLMDWLVLGRRGWRPLLAVAPMFAAAALLAAVTAHEEWYAGADTCAEPLWLRPLAAARALWFYVGALLLPLDLKVLYPKWQVAASPGWIAALVAALAAVAGIVLARRKLGGAAVWCLAHFAISLGPILGLLPFGYLCYAPVSDHFAYLASVGLLILVGMGLERASRSRAWSAAPLVAVVTLVLAVATWQRVGVYRGTVEFWGEALRGNPGSPFCRKQFAQALSGAGRYRESLPLWESLVAVEPNNARYRTSQGAALIALGRGAEAMTALRTAIAADPNYAPAHYNMACLLGEQGQLPAALNHAQQAIRLAPGDGKNYRLLGLLFAELGDREQALAAFQTALSLARRSGDGAQVREIETAIEQVGREPPRGAP